MRTAESLLPESDRGTATTRRLPARHRGRLTGDPRVLVVPAPSISRPAAVAGS